MRTESTIDRPGLLAAIAAYAIWGVFPLFWYLIRDVASLEIIAHRVIWCCLFVVGYLLWRDGRRWLRDALAGRHVLRWLTLSSVLISCNWGIYIWAVTHGRVIDASLGYFINPLVNVVIGVVVLKERLNRTQWFAVGLAALGVAWLTLRFGQPPWIALALAFSFAFYGLIRKTAHVEAVPGLAIESLILVVPALGYAAWLAAQDQAAFLSGGAARDALLIVGGALTALPLIGFAFGARRIPYSLTGVLQYVAPTLQLLCGVWILGEPFVGSQLVGFGLIWLALVLYAADGLRRNRRQKQRPAAVASAWPPTRADVDAPPEPGSEAGRN